ncbi:uncharacterized protein FIBRA_06267 [Fibroporia radiculosa]|uniref:Uncharacterized protein n=1 Tax=Fibroporia radiculosa TaxID=599839 RepID=J4HYU7_9APHY|nr:uncharacterized protein FIBRA_06267 [Fibroporia radiculosa]CCM04107.1 predicted protein [Fibroporia radiculosa]
MSANMRSPRLSSNARNLSDAKPSIESSEVIAETRSISDSRIGETDDDVQLFEEFGYVPSFKREFSNLATISFAFSIMGLCSSVATTFNTPLLMGGPASVTWCWILGSCMCFTLGSSIAEIVSAFPTCGGLYTASAQLCPPRHRAIVGWIIGWLNLLGHIAGLASSEFGLAEMIWAAVVISRDGNYIVTQNMTVGLFIGLIVFTGLLNCLATRQLSQLTKGFVFINIGTTILIIVVLLAMTPRSDMHPASYVFGSAGLVNQSKGWGSGLAFVFGLLSVQWTMTGYDATAHISEEVRRAAYAAPTAIFMAVVGTGLLGWVFNIVVVLCSGPLENLPGPSGSAFLQIMVMRIGKPGALVLWALVCLTAFFVCQTALQASSRMVYAFSRDHGLPDRGYFGHVTSWTTTPLRAVWFTTLLSVLPGLLDLASPVSANAVFALCAMSLDSSYTIPIILRRLYRNHPEVKFKPGPFYMGDGLLGWAANIACVFWALFVSVIFCIPTERPVTKSNMNYASLMCGGVVILSGIWFICGFNLDQEEEHSCMRGCLDAPLFCGHKSTLVQLLSIPFLPPPPLRARHILRHGTGNTLLGRLNLPPELLFLICDNFDRLLDAISFGLANTILFSIAQKKIHKLQCAKYACWVNSRIICLGDHTDDNDLPEGMMTKAELEAIHKRAELSDDFDPDDICNLYDAACVTFRERSSPQTFFWIYHCEFSSDLSRSEHKEFQRLYEPVYEIEGDKTGPWALCNLSKREFVRADATAKVTGAKSMGPFIASKINLGTVLISQICWSSDDSTASSYERPIHRGAWAGDRFVITTLDRLEASSEYKDVSNTVLAVLTGFQKYVGQ